MRVGVRMSHAPLKTTSPIETMRLQMPNGDAKTLDTHETIEAQHEDCAGTAAVAHNQSFLRQHANGDTLAWAWGLASDIKDAA